MSLKRSGLKAVSIGGVVFVTGGFSGIFRIKTTEFYDPREGKWHLLKNMNMERLFFFYKSCYKTAVLMLYKKGSLLL